MQRETEKEAKDFLHYYVHEKGDWVAAENLMKLLGIGSLAVEDFLELQAHFMAGWGAFPLVGTKEQVVDALANLSKVGIRRRVAVVADLRGGDARRSSA